MKSKTIGSSIIFYLAVALLISNLVYTSWFLDIRGDNIAGLINYFLGFINAVLFVSVYGTWGRIALILGILSAILPFFAMILNNGLHNLANGMPF